MKFLNSKHRLFWLTIFLIATVSVLNLALMARNRAVQPDSLAVALQRVRDAGSYHFTLNVKSF